MALSCHRLTSNMHVDGSSTRRGDFLKSGGSGTLNRWSERAQYADDADDGETKRLLSNNLTAQPYQQSF